MVQKYNKTADFCFVSTMNQEYFDIVGKDMISSFLLYTKFLLRIYAEDLTTIVSDNRITYYDWNVSCKHSWQKFKQKTSDAKSIKFAKKGFAFLHALKTINEKYIIWVDADLKFLKHIDEKIIKQTIGSNLIGLFDHSYLNLGGYSAESGYVILNTHHTDYNKFVELYEYYYSVDKKPEQLANWYDGQVCMLAASHFDNVYNLSTLSYNKTSHTPLNYCPLNEYIIHYKGKKTKRFIKNTQ